MENQQQEKEKEKNGKRSTMTGDQKEDQREK
jgi:hypothetical protein